MLGLKLNHVGERGHRYVFQDDDGDDQHVPLTRYVRLRVARATGMSETFSPQLIAKETAS